MENRENVDEEKSSDDTRLAKEQQLQKGTKEGRTFMVGEANENGGEMI